MVFWTAAGLFLAGLLYLIFTAHSRQFNKLVNRLLEAGAEDPAPRTFSYSQLTGLPDPVQRYLRLVLKEGDASPEALKLTQEGWIKSAPRQKPLPLKCTEYIRSSPPGFVWEGKNRLFSGIDAFVEGRGELTIRLLSGFKILGGKGPQYDEGELMRLLGEGVFCPRSLLPGPYLRWEPVDEKSARIFFNYRGTAFDAKITFNSRGELVQMETKRWMNANCREDWIGRFARYREMDGRLVPTLMQAGWKLPQGDFYYILLKLKTLESFTCPPGRKKL